MKPRLTFFTLCLVAGVVAGTARAEETPYGKLNSKSVQLYAEGKYDEAIAAGEEALKLAEQTLPPGDKNLLIILDNLASIYDGAKKEDKAIATYEHILAIQEKDPTTELAAKARTLYSIGEVNLSRQDWVAAERYFRRSLELRELVLGADHNDTIVTVNRLAWVLQNQHKYAEVLPLLERVLATWEKTKGPDAPELGYTCNNLGLVNERLKNKADVERYFKRAITIREKHPGEKDADLIMSLQELASYYRDHEKYKSAEPLYKELLALQEKNLGKDNPELLPTLRSYAIVVGPEGLQKRNVADALKKRIAHLEPLEGMKDESQKAKRPAY